MIVMQPVLEVARSDGFDLWPVATMAPYGWLALGGELTPAEIGTAVHCIVDYVAVDPGDEPAMPADPLDAFLHGLLTVDAPIAPGGLRVIDDASDVTFVPGCCDGLEDWRDWRRLFSAGGTIGFGHPPTSPSAERVGDCILLTVDAEQDGSPTIELPVAELSRLLDAVERDLTDFYALVVEWAPRHLPGREAAVSAAIARVLDLEG
ncbi:hypothetical protein E1263_18670 [Kribbella antibiotica]|uniref:Uncharacterized protein n=1 Tax=Kribbella antibiotica TaxID=190195 RepID=A0A4R4ZK66_9ACTN|nr:hypothetical protein [Kribbella antibiotica]TDD58540.1 hypothetical protein E1263_18670 [Kribbella antibiotica]